jgi:Tol biopolymer transport system component
VAALTGPVSFAWSPDGKRVAYVEGTNPQQPTVGKLSFAEIAADGTVKNTQVDTDSVIAFFWAPDSSRVVDFVLAQAEVPTATPGPTPDANSTPTASGPAYYLKMYVADAASGGNKVIVPQFSPSQDFWRTIPYFDQYARSGTIWSPDSQYIIVSAYAPDGKPGVFVVPSSGVTAPRFLQDGTMAFWSAK